MAPTTELPLLDELLAVHRDTIGDDFDPYRNHIYRVLNYCFAMRDCDAADRDKLMIAGAFHDIGLWTHDTLDYLDPSAELARAELTRRGREDWSEEVSLLVVQHHKLRRDDHPQYPLVEVFRRADLVDVSLGAVRFGLPRSTVRAVKQAFPNAGFHKRLTKFAGRQLVRDPLHPLPMMRW